MLLGSPVSIQWARDQEGYFTAKELTLLLVTEMGLVPLVKRCFDSHTKGEEIMAILVSVSACLLFYFWFDFPHGLWGGVIVYFLFSLSRMRKRMAQMETDLKLEIQSLKLLLDRMSETREESRPAREPVRESVQPEPDPTPESATDSLPDPSPAPERPLSTDPSPLPWQSIPEAPPVPSWWGQAGKSVWTYFTTGNTIAKVGVLLLFVGVSFLLKYVSEQGWFPIELRLLTVAISSLVLLGLGWRMREKRNSYALLLQGAGIGIFYLTTFAGFRLVEVLPASLAFVLLLGAVILSSILALLQDSRVLALFSAGGGFLAPVLASTGQGSHVGLFSYYAVLNLGVFVMAWYRSWRSLNLLGFLFTFVIGGVWGLRYYRPEHFASTEPFLIFFFLLYVAITLLFAIKKREPRAFLVDATLAFGVPATAFGLQIGLVKDSSFGLAASAIAFGSFYLMLARFALHRFGELARLLVEALFAIGVCFLTLSVPLALDGRSTAAVWALEGVAVLWVGLRQGRLIPRCSGLILQGLAGLAFLFSADRPFGAFPILNANFLGAVILAVSHLGVGWFLHRTESSKVQGWEKKLVPWMMGLGLLWWSVGGVSELNHSSSIWGEALIRVFPKMSFSNILTQSRVLFFACSTLLWVTLARKGDWDLLAKVRWALMPIMIFFAMVLSLRDVHPFADIGLVSWSVAFWVHYRCLRRSEADSQSFETHQHFSAAWLLTLLVAGEAYWFGNQVVGGTRIWALTALAWVPVALALLVIRARPGSVWPLGLHRERYLGLGVAPHLAWGMFWTLILNFTHSGDPGVLSYIPLLNPLDLTQVFVWMAVGAWYLEARKARLTLLPEAKVLGVVMGCSAFLWITAGLTRALHHFAGLPWSFSALFDSSLVQASLSIYWSLVALGVMSLSTRKSWRMLWIAGASLLGVVVVKLVLVDLSGRGTLERVVSFLGTGVLLMLIGYFAPLPRAIENPVGEDSQ
jgi:uncharacterized membrane protein